MKKPRQDQEQVTAAVAAAVAKLAPFVRNGTFDGRPLVGGIRILPVREIMLRAKLLDRYDDDRDQKLIEEAIDGDVMVDTLLREVANEKLEALPPNLKRYVSHVLANKIRPNKGGRPVNFFIRDTMIFSAVEATRSRGFRLARNETTKTKSATESASSIVSTALEKLGVTLSEKSITRIWRSLPAPVKLGVTVAEKSVARILAKPTWDDGG